MDGQLAGPLAGFLFGALLLVFFVANLLHGKARWGIGAVASRAANPIAFWALQGLYIAMAMYVFLVSLYALDTLLPN